MKILADEFSSKLHDINKVDFMNMIYRILSYKDNEKMKNSLRE